jgi:hypothetical protein
MKGSLSQRPPFDVLSEVQHRQASGILRLQRGESVRQIFVDGGIMIRFAASNLPGESMTSLFKEKGGVGDDQLRKATAAKKAEELLGTTLVRLGMLTPLALAQITADHIRRVLHNAFALREGEYEFQPGALPFREQLDGGLSTAEVLLLWAREMPDLEVVRRHLGSTSARVQMARRPPEGYQQVPLNPAEGYIMSRVDGSATVDEICIVSPMGEETTLRALFGLALAGIIEIPRQAASAAQPHPAAAQPHAAAVRRAAPPQAPRPSSAPQPPAAHARPAGTAQPAPPAPPAARAQPSGPAPAGPPDRTVSSAPGAAGPRPAPPAGAPSAAVTPGRVPSNGGAPKPAAQAPGSTGGAAPAQAKSAARPGTAPARPGAASARPGTAPRPGTAAPRRVTGVSERVRPATAPDLEAEMLQRFDQIRDQDLYQVLGALATASTSDIRRAYYGLAKRFHPDKFTRDELKAKAEKVFGHITEAYSTLSREESRRKYDEDMASRRPRSHEKTTDTHDLARLNFRHGKEQFDKGRFGEALSFFQNACEQDPARSEHFFYLAQTQSKNPRWKKDAETNFLKALEIDPSNADIYAHLGLLYARGGLHSKARDLFKRALQWDPANAVALEGLAAEEEGGKKGLLGMFKK